ncbi:hypothetical protein MAPG_01473 [Magnaporthiopsis poae ATCC 64411]|uniref:Secreted protein n=1 Tax=Magnaporthiopsis poae (strain ATCC 64411 / 73-15) TaxID=644358 RepID=A0A0C4DNS8_MAGP6|nr:hypothetical protein MAPG_01473 [Magnaporthiopsis poae ATCC 64411]
MHSALLSRLITTLICLVWLTASSVPRIGRYRVVPLDTPPPMAVCFFLGIRERKLTDACIFIIPWEYPSCLSHFLGSFPIQYFYSPSVDVLSLTLNSLLQRDPWAVPTVFIADAPSQLWSGSLLTPRIISTLHSSPADTGPSVSASRPTTKCHGRVWRLLRTRSPRRGRYRPGHCLTRCSCSSSLLGICCISAPGFLLRPAAGHRDCGNLLH